ncbi:hypothetical protein PNEG_03102 [Pneumocystis murina B123]|uniref:Uncharacterized protein n=1 Tax=Pneumocystis murina (strain B123) TaxID=1069680 RepID=M7P432_PNEMU|nr:hypothetical protein PNEG_03102 [Pneumocystis murina B123]EMR08625.1 hypothetical protein PNEG_03102 [Pneumocystis murina B123]
MIDIVENKDLNLGENRDFLASENLTVNSQNEEEKVDENENKSIYFEKKSEEDNGYVPFFAKKPRRSNNPLHILIQECSRQYIVNFLSKKSESCQRQLISDFDKLKDDLKLFCNYDVLENAKESIISQNEKFQYEDINLDSEIINLRFDEKDAVIKSFSDAIDELYYENSKKSKDVTEELDLDSIDKSLRIWYELAASNHIKDDTKCFLKNVPREPKNMEQKRNMSRNRQRSRYRDKKYSKNVENSHSIHYSDSRRGRGRKEMREKFRSLQKDHSNTSNCSLSIQKNSNENSLNNSANLIPGYIHPNFHHPGLPYNNYVQQNYIDYNHIQMSANHTSYPVQYNNAYYNYINPQNVQYGAPLMNNQYQKLKNYSEINQSNIPITWNSQENISFTSDQQGRHQHLPLPSDFMLGPIDGARIVMPEPHYVLGVIKGMVIRDGQGNFGISKYSFIPI